MEKTAMEKQYPLWADSENWSLSSNKEADHAELHSESSSGTSLFNNESVLASKDWTEKPLLGNYEDVCSIKLEKDMFDRWCQIREAEGCHSDSQVAWLLLKWHDSQSKNKWCVECVYCQALLTVSLVYSSCQTLPPYPATSKAVSTASSPGKAESFPGSGFSIVPLVEKHDGIGGECNCSTGNLVDHVTAEKADCKTGDNTPELIQHCDSLQKGIYQRDHSNEICDMANEIEPYTKESHQSHFDCDGLKCNSKFLQSSGDGKLALTEKRQCEQCIRTSSSSAAMTAHMEKARVIETDSQLENSHLCVGKKSTQIECSVCGKYFLSKTRLQAHVHIHCEDKLYWCDECKKSFKTSNSFQAHTLNIHKDVKPVNSDECKAANSSSADIFIHKKTHKTKHPFVCSECGLSYKNSLQLSGHLKQAHSQPKSVDTRTPFRCEMCPKVFKFKSSLVLHMKSHVRNSDSQKQPDVKSSHEELSCDTVLNAVEEQMTHEESSTSFVCLECGQNFSSDHLLQEHTQTHSEDKLFACSACKKKFKSKRGLYGHKQRKHIRLWQKESGCYKCDKCDAVFRFKTQLTKHKRSHKNERPFSCSQCGAKFKSMSNLRLHESWHEDMRSTVCHLCGKSSLGMKSLTRHIKMHHGLDNLVEKPHKCSDCTASFVSLSQLTSHRGVHSQHHNFVCQLCGQAFRSEHILTIHVRRHTGEKPFQCSECQESFIDKTSLNRHQLQHMPKSKELCHVCGAGFPSKAHLAFHIQRHTTERPFKCSQCGKAYKTTGDLKSHMMSHSDDRPFQCTHCSYAARTKAMLTKHNRKHTGERPYHCEQCSSSFTYFSCLAAHRKLHSNNKPFVCEVCKAAFFTAYNLRLHSRKHSGERPYQCPVCPESFSWHSGLKCHLKKHQTSAGSGAALNKESSG